MNECRSAAWPVGRAVSLAAACLVIQAAALPPAACTAADAAVAIGTPLPRLRLNDFRGREWATDEFVGRGPVVIAFLGAECPLAGLYSARLVDLEGEFGPRGIAFVAVNSNVQDSLTAMAAHARRSTISFPYLKDPDQAFADGLGVTRTPEVCVVDSSGTLR